MGHIRRARAHGANGLIRLGRATVAIAALLTLGTTGYYGLGRLHASGRIEPMLDRPWTPLECFYMTAITVSTVGYAETLPTPEGDLDAFDDVRVYTTGLVLLGMLLVGYSVSSATAFLIEGDLQRFWWHRRARLDASKLENHYIVCGCGVTGRAIIDELQRSGYHVVGIDEGESALLDYLQRDDVVGLEGDATDDDVLRQAGVERARGLAACLPNDKDNLYLLISARQLNPNLRIATLASSEKEREKLLRAGADAVVSSANIGGLRIASELARPAVVSFLDLMLRGPHRNVRFAEITVDDSWEGQPLASLRSDLPILARRRSADDIVYNPPGDTLLSEGDVLVTMGPLDQVEALSAKLGARHSFYVGEE